MKTIQEKSIDKSVIDELFVAVPTGTVELRDDRIKKVWEVDIAAFHLSKFPVTQGLYEALIHEKPATFEGGSLPVETVSWIEAVTFCNKLSEQMGRTLCYTIDLATKEVAFDSEADGFRLPTEAEWQYACQAGKKNIRYGELDAIAWYKGNSGNQTQEVGKKLPNEWGLYDMLGMVHRHL